MKICCISDTHNRHEKLSIPECDILICSGDITGRGELENVLDFARWFNVQPAKHLILVPGNHEKGWERDIEKYNEEILKVCPRVNILIDRTIIINGIKIHGSPVTPFFFNWAWNRAVDPNPVLCRSKVMVVPEIKPHWDMVPDDVNILVTHGPPYGILDLLIDGHTRVGCNHLMNRINELKELKLHVFGHIHYSSGEQYFNGIKFVNASVCDEEYYPINPVRIVEI